MRAHVAVGEPHELQPLSLSPAPSLSFLRRAATVWPPSKIQFRRCSLKPPLRTKSVGTKVSEAEFALLEERACGAGLRLAEWVREALLAARAEPGVDSGEVALAEVLALRSLLLNLHFRAAKGEPVAEAEMRGLIERADGVKMQRARERLEAVRTEARKADGETNPEEG
jgi:hypothetical protein